MPKIVVIEERMTSPIQSFAHLFDDELLASDNLSAWCEQIVQGRFGGDGRPVTQDNCERRMEHDGAGGAALYSMKPSSVTPACTAILLLSSLAAAQVQPSFPKPSGPFDVGRLEIDVTDASREEAFTDDRSDKRRLLVSLY